jgi:hypothetical protein
MVSLKKEMTQNLEELCNFHNIKNSDKNKKGWACGTQSSNILVWKPEWSETTREI